MTIQATGRKGNGVAIFYVQSESKPDVQYTVQYIRQGTTRRWFCTCPDFFYRKLRRKKHCKHCREVAARAKQAGGVTRLQVAPAV